MATGYTRQHASDITTGAIILASYFNDEYDAIKNAFDASSGHNHDGTTGGGGPISVTAAIGTLPVAHGGTGSTTAATARTALGLAIGTDVQAWDADLDALAALAATAGMISRTGAGAFAVRTLTAPAAGFSITNPTGSGGNPTFVLANDLAALEALSGTGIVAHTASETYAERTLTAPAAGFTITNPAGIAGNPTFVLANDLAALEAMSGTGIAVHTGSETWTERSIAVTSSTGLNISNGSGVSGNPTLSGIDADTSTKGVSELATSAETVTGTDTTRTVTPAGVAAATIYQGLHTLYVPASAMISRTTNGPAAGTTESTTNKVMRKTLDFDASTQEHAQFTVAFPKSWDVGTVTAEFYWGATNTGDCVWGLQGLSLADDDVIDTAFGTGVEVTDSVTASTDLMHSAATTAITISNTPASGDLCWFQVYRKAAAAGDTLAVDALLLGVKLFFTISAKNDA